MAEVAWPAPSVRGAGLQIRVHRADECIDIRYVDSLMASSPPELTPYTSEDAAWLATHQKRKCLDERVRIIGVPARAPDGHPLVLTCYPLRETADPAADGRGGSANKWRSAEPVPWYNMFWLVDPELTRRIGRLEHLGCVKRCQQMVHEQEDLRAALAEAHAEYARARWSLLSEEDRTYCERKGWADLYRDTGVAGLRCPEAVKCLHTHTAHALASGGRNPIGKWALDALERGDDAAALAQPPAAPAAGAEPHCSDALQPSRVETY